MAKAAADSATRQELDLMQETISEDQAKRVVEKLSNNLKYKASHFKDMLIIHRFLKD
jgi:hypothetical protein